MKKRLITLSLLLLFTLSTMTFAKAFDATNTGSSKPDHITLTWTSKPYTSQTITWRTDASVATGNVQVSLFDNKDKIGDSGVTTTVEAKNEAFASEDNKNMYLHSALLSGLTPGTKYAYRVGTDGNYSDLNSFTTESSNAVSFKFLVFGDSQSGDTNTPNYTPWHDTIQNAFAANKDAKFIVNMGDLVENGQYYVHWNNWFDAAKGVIDTIPEMSVQGNHETYITTSSNSIKPVFWMSQFKNPQNGPDNLKGQVYSYDYGNVHFVVLDSQQDEEKTVAGDILSSQKSWLEKDLASTTKQWKIVMFHKTPYYNKATRTNELIKSVFTPVFDKYHVDLVFNGHDHGVSRTYPINNGVYVQKPSQGTIYYVTGRSGNKYYTDLSQKVWDAFFYNPEDQPCYETVNVNDDKLTINAVKQDGTLIDSYTIDKGNDTDSPLTILPPKYKNTHLAIYGNLVNYQLSSFPVQQNNKWYVPASAFVSFQGGFTTPSAVGLTIALGGKTISLPLTNIVKLNNDNYISADDIKTQLGFSYNYDANNNILYFTK